MARVFIETENPTKKIVAINYCYKNYSKYKKKKNEIKGKIQEREKFFKSMFFFSGELTKALQFEFSRKIIV